MCAVGKSLMVMILCSRNCVIFNSLVFAQKISDATRNTASADVTNLPDGLEHDLSFSWDVELNLQGEFGNVLLGYGKTANAVSVL